MDELPESGEDVELLIFQTEEYEEEPKTAAGQYMDSPSTSLWIRSGDAEFPVFSHEEFGCWNTPEPDFSFNVESNEVSEAFIEGVGRLPDDEDGGFTGIEKETWEEMSKPEQWIAHTIKEGVAYGRPRDEPKLVVVAICREKLSL